MVEPRGPARWITDLPVWLLIGLLASMGGMNLLWSFMLTGPVDAWFRLVQHLPLHVTVYEPLPSALAGLFLLFLGRGLLRRKRRAWLMVLLLMLGLLSYRLALAGFDLRAALAGGMILLLLVSWRSFPVQSDFVALKHGLWLIGIGYPLSWVISTAGLYALGQWGDGPPDLATAARQAAIMATRFYNPEWNPTSQMAFFFELSVYALYAIILGYGLALVLRPVALHQPPTAAERQRARQIVEAHGRTAMAYLAVLEDKHYFFSQGGSLIAYTIRHRVAVTLGDPIGPAEDVAATVAEFCQHCALRDWWPAFCLTYPDYMEIYQAAGYSAMCMGHEAVVDLRTFKLDGRANKTFRKRYNRMHRQGYRVVFYAPPLPDTLLEDLRRVSDEWLAMTYGEEKRFFLGWFYEDYIRNSEVAAVHTPEGRIIAFTNLVPEYQLNESTIDLMRHRQRMPSGTMDFLFVELFQHAREQGFDTFNLGLSALSGLGKRPGGVFVERILNYLYENWSEYYNFKGLRDFKDKFHPYWVPQYLVYPGLLRLPEAWIAMARANSGDFQPWGYFKRRISIKPPTATPARQVWLPS